MDPISQGAVGAAFAQSTGLDKNLAKVTLIGCVAGMAPDLDVLIQSRQDPILFLEYHRQFTHSIIFVPIGALLVALVVSPFLKGVMEFKTTYVASFVGYATHGLLDACTSYGTQLFWPFSSERIAWNNISIVDPLFTLPILVLIFGAIKKRRIIFSWIAVGWALSYLALGFVQYERAFLLGEKIAISRGHEASRLTLKPSFGNLILWKSIYEHQNVYFVDAIRIVGSSTWCSGESISKLNINEHLPGLDKTSQQFTDIQRFFWFSQGYLGFDHIAGLVSDIRYSMVPNDVTPMWGLQIDTRAEVDQHAYWWSGREVDIEQFKTFGSLLMGSGCYQKLPTRALAEEQL
jgi:inner membrane protein